MHCSYKSAGHSVHARQRHRLDRCRRPGFSLLVGVREDPETKQSTPCAGGRTDAPALHGAKKGGMQEQKVVSKSALARSLGIARSALYYIPRKEKKDWELKVKIEEVLRAHFSY